jgi:hypothetical protein
MVLLAAAAADATADLSTPDERPVVTDLALVSSLDARDEMVDVGEYGHGRSDGSRDRVLQAAASLAVPGAGQLLQGHKRGYIFLLAEAALWGGFYLLDREGMEERDDYETFADDHWDYAAYSAWYEQTCVDCPSCDEYLCRPLAEYGTQEYYEDIGKYNTYWRWWNFDGDETYVDWDDYSDEDVELRNAYYDMRNESNRHLEQARYAMMAALLNHVVAAVDAFLSADEDGGEPIGSRSDLGVEFDVAESGDGLRCALTARY